MSVTEDSFDTIAKRHGVELSDVQPKTKEARIEQLKGILANNDVPFPIDQRRGEAYLKSFVENQPFGIGTLGEMTVDLTTYANFQTYDNYTQREHLSWACLIADQQATKHQFACREYLAGEKMFEIGGTVIPDYYILNARIYQQTQWQLATVNMIIPAELFFTCHSKRFFPVTTFMRDLEQDYLEEPDIGHDVAGHVATFTIPSVAQVMVNHGLARDLIYQQRDDEIASSHSEEQVEKIKAKAEQLLTYAGRIYWFTVEFGLVMQGEDGVRDFGAGILSSPGETKYSIASTESNRILIDPSCDHDLLRLATTDYLISEFQKTYFVMKSFDLLESLTPERIVEACKLAVELPHYTWREVAPGDETINVGSVVTSPNEKYFRLMADQPIDDCLTRAAVRNLRLYANGLTGEHLARFKTLPPEVSQGMIAWFKKADEAGQFANIES